MAEYSPGTVRVWHGKWQGMINVREREGKPWKRKTKVLRTYHEPDPEHVGIKIEKDLPEPTGRITKAMTKLAEIALKEWRDELIGDSGRVSDPNATVGDYITFYLNTLESSKLVEQSTMGPYRCAEKIFKGRRIGNILLRELTQEDGEALIAEMVEDGYAASSIRKHFNVLHGAIKHAVSTKTLLYDPLAGVKTPKIVAKEPNSLDAASLNKLVTFLDSAEPNKASVAIAIALYTGMREAEVCGLRWGDVDLENKIIRVRNVVARAGGKLYEKEPKTRAGRRDIPFDENLAKVITKRLDDAKEECRIAGINLSDSMYVVGNLGDGTGKYMNPHKLWSDWKALANAMGLKGMRGTCPTFHDLRHTNATIATHLPGTDLKSVQRNLGHASIKTTVDIYASDDPEARRSIAEQTGSAISNAKARGQVLKMFSGGLRTGTDG